MEKKTKEIDKKKQGQECKRRTKHNHKAALHNCLGKSMGKIPEPAYLKRGVR